MKKDRKLYLMIMMMVIALITLTRGLDIASKDDPVIPDPNQYFGEVAAIASAGEERVISLIPAETPYPQHDQVLHQKIELVVPESVTLTARIGPNGERLDIGLGDLLKIYDKLKVGDKIAFRTLDWISDDRAEAEAIIFTGE